ncbi:Protein kinase domain containing protein [Reticulomyxa filosa]|uniref:Protein kinase domain containing protein n=1 Tax=Reticulomyxa filosa TaxID=46433 RepID=X6NX67_RETFI|nr:Protein kinase domain containing protein [Reticulomyxa filosa]|eukprot:ETO30890.1 Protein kinase domain containing protein [Reticulomyxa filosa]
MLATLKAVEQSTVPTTLATYEDDAREDEKDVEPALPESEEKSETSEENASAKRSDSSVTPHEMDEIREQEEEFQTKKTEPEVQSTWGANGVYYPMNNAICGFFDIRIHNNRVFSTPFWYVPQQDESGVVSWYTFARYKYEKLLANTLQGYICVVQDQYANCRWAVKAVHKRNITLRLSNNEIKVPENFLNEVAILRRISAQKQQGQVARPELQFFTGLVDYWETRDQIFVAMEYCNGQDLFDFVQQTLHKRNEWKPKVESLEHHEMMMKSDNVYPRFRIIRNLFLQMVSAVQYLHQVLHICHRDISLENFIVFFPSNCNSSNRDDANRLHLKLIDFGLAKDWSHSILYENSSEKGNGHVLKEQRNASLSDSSFVSNKCVGKLHYQSPECYNCHTSSQNTYNCKLNDTYCLGICLAMLLFRQHLYKLPSATDSKFAHLIKHGVMHFIQSSKCQYLVNQETVDLLEHLLVPESKRLFIQDVYRHPFFHPSTLSSS